MLVDMTKQQTQTVKTREIIEGKVMLRFISYTEVGKHKSVFQGQESIKDKVHLVFEVYGKNYPLDEYGNPLRVTVKENYSLHDKANFKKLFMMMRNNDSEIKHISELLGKAFIGNIYKYTIEGKEYPTLKGKDGYKIGPDYIEDPVTGETKTVAVPGPVGSIKKFIWAYPTKEDWDSLYIDGQYNDGNSKNVIQNVIKSALNYQGSQVQMIAEGVSFTPKPIVLPEQESIVERKSFNPSNRFNRTKVNEKQKQDSNEEINF